MRFIQVFKPVYINHLCNLLTLQLGLFLLAGLTPYALSYIYICNLALQYFGYLRNIEITLYI